MLEELKAEGLTDYVIVEVVFSSGSRNSVSLATRRPGGFSDHDISEVQNLLHVFTLAMENFIHRDMARTLLDPLRCLDPRSGLLVARVPADPAQRVAVAELRYRGFEIEVLLAEKKRVNRVRFRRVPVESPA